MYVSKCEDVLLLRCIYIHTFHFRFRELLPAVLGGSRPRGGGGGRESTSMLSEAAARGNFLCWRSLLAGAAAGAGDLTWPLPSTATTTTTGEVLRLLLLLLMLELLLPALDDLLRVFNFMVGFTAAQISQVAAEEQLLMKVQASHDQPCVSGGFGFEFEFHCDCDCDRSTTIPVRANSP